VPGTAAGAEETQASNVGHALDDVCRLAEDLQEGMLPNGAVRLDTPPPSPSLQYSAKSLVDSRDSVAEGLFGRLMQWRRWGEVKGDKGSATSSPAAWEEYARYIQEV